jgi:hypothetical protein
MVRIRKNEGETSFGNFLRDRIAKNRNCVILVTGNPGTGKTYSAISIGCWIHELMGLKDLFGQQSWIFTIKTLLKIMHENTTDAERAKYLRGRPFLYEEVSEEQLNTRANSQAAVSTIQTLATFRSLGCILIMTVPREGQLQKALKSYCDIWLKTQGIDYHNKLCHVNIRYTEWSDELDKMRAYYAFVDMKEREYRNIELVVPKPPQSLIDKYEEHKLAFQHRIYGEKIKRLEENDAMKENKRTKKTQQRYLQKCPTCGYEWVSAVQFPLVCGGCKKPMSGKKRESDAVEKETPVISVSTNSDMEKGKKPSSSGGAAT